MNLFKKYFVGFTIMVVIVFLFDVHLANADYFTFMSGNGSGCTVIGNINLDKTEYIVGEPIVTSAEFTSIGCASSTNFINAYDINNQTWPVYVVTNDILNPNPPSRTFYPSGYNPAPIPGSYTVNFYIQVNDYNGIVIANSKAVNYTVVSASTSIPTLSNATASYTATTATLGANVDLLGIPSALIPARYRGFCYGTVANPNWTNANSTCVTEGGYTAGAYSKEISGLNSGTKYYYRGYATNPAGTGYSAEKFFTTSAIVPTVTLIKDVDDYKNLVRYYDTTDTATGYLSAYVDYLPNTGDHCHIILNGEKKEPPWQTFSNFQGWQDFDVNNLNAPDNNDIYQLKCYNASEASLLGAQSLEVSFNTQSGTMTTSGNVNSCIIPYLRSTCSIVTSWTTTNPRDGTTTYPEGASLPGIAPSDIGNSVAMTFSGVGIIANNATSGTTALSFINAVDGENGTSTLSSPAENTIASKQITLNCQISTKWNGSVCFNALPVVSAGLDRTIDTNTYTIPVNQATATDDGPGLLTLLWVNTAKPNGATVSISNDNTKTPTFNGLTLGGEYKFKLTATNSIQSNFDEMVIIKNAPGYFSVMASAGTGGSVDPTGRSVASGSTTTFNVTPC